MHVLLVETALLCPHGGKSHRCRDGYELGENQRYPPVAGRRGLVAGVTALGTVEFRMRGTAAISGFTAENYKARAQSEDPPAPDFTLPSLEGNEPIVVSSFRGNLLVVNLWASWCGPCRLEAPGLPWASERYWDQGVRFLGVDERDHAAAARAFVAEFHLPYPIASDPGVWPPP